MKKLLSTKEAAEYLGLAPITLSKKRCYPKPGDPAYIKCGSAIRYRIEDLDAWVLANRHECATEGA